MNAGEIVINTKLETKDFDREIRHLEQELEGLEEEYELVKSVKPFEGQQEYLEQLSKKILKTKKNLNSLVIEKEKFEKSDLKNIESQIGNVGKSVESVTKKVGRWAMAIFGVRSAYMFVRNAINTITQDDAQLQSDIEFMKKALAYTIEPIVRTIVNLMKTLMQYVAYIVKAWTGRDIFASASKNLKSANKSAKALQKTSASFDKFNKLSASSSSVGGGGATPSIGGLQGKVPEWLDWIAKNKDKVTAGLIAIASGLVAVKLGLKPIQGLGLGVALYGIMTTILNIIKFLKEPTFNNFIKILQSIALAVTGIAMLFGAWPVAIGGAIAFVILKLEEIGHFFEDIFKGIKKIIKGIVQMFKGDLVGGIKTAFSGLVDILQAPFKALIRIINSVIKGINKVTGSKIPLISIDSNKGSMGGRAKGGIFYPSKLPRLAKGGIVNMPGKGVAYHGATIGERGAEAVVPLTDNAQMELLGASIGKHVTVNADITLELESRVLARVMEQINNDKKFARNGG